MNLFYLCLIGYLVGSIPSGFLLARYAKGIDLRDFGSNSTGATNVLRTGSKKLAFITLLLDVLKGFIFSFIVSIFFDGIYLYISSFCCLLGHVYPVWLRFKGGKGVATVAGIFLMLAPFAALFSAFIWGIVAKFIKISSVASLSFSFSFAFINIFRFFSGSCSIDLVLFSTLVFLFLIYTHHDNIKRLFLHEEDDFSKKLYE